MSRITVVKLGGSLLTNPLLDKALWQLSQRSQRGGEVVIVPGGGVFADAVRAAQPQMCFDEHAAHQMAILAMAQTALVLQSRCPALQRASTPAQVAAVLARGGVACWQPTVMPEVEAGWHITSDSLAAWLARQLGARRLVLVKSGAVPQSESAGPAQWQAWMDAGWVDAAFGRFAAQAGAEVALLSLEGLTLR